MPVHATMTLGDLAVNDTAVITELPGGWRLSNRLAALGLTPGTRITMLQNTGRGPVIVLVRGIRLALGRGEASRVPVARTTAPGVAAEGS